MEPASLANSSSNLRRSRSQLLPFRTRTPHANLPLITPFKLLSLGHEQQSPTRRLPTLIQAEPKHEAQPVPTNCISS